MAPLAIDIRGIAPTIRHPEGSTTPFSGEDDNNIELVYLIYSKFEGAVGFVKYP